MVFRNGTIEWDLYTTGQRSYPGIFFRVSDKMDYEHFYIRPHKTNGLNADALQYTPAWHNVSCWQLYHGEGYTKATVIPSDEWVHYRLVVKDDRAIVFIGDMARPALIIHKLEHGVTEGDIFLNCPADGSAYFANFSVSEEIMHQFGPQLTKPVIPGALKSWQVSMPITNNNINNTDYPGTQFLDELAQVAVVADSSGLVNLTRAVVRNPAQPGWVYARTTIHSKVEESQWYSLGYSDYVTVFLNGEPVYQGINSFTSRDPSYQGLPGYYDMLNLKLKKGDNELVLLVGEEFGGWGFMFRDTESEILAKGVTKGWTLSGQLSYPESVAWDKSNNVLYVSNYTGEQPQYISRVSAEGKVLDKKWVTGLSMPTAIELVGDTLYVTERRSIALIDIRSASVSRRISLEMASAPNDLATTNNGSTIYVSDSQANCIYKIEKGKVEKWVTEIPGPNSIAIDGNRLLVGCMGDNSLKSIDLKTREVTVLMQLFPGAIIDGIVVLQDKSVLVADFQGIMYRVGKDGSFSEIINCMGNGINFSDFIYNVEKQQLVIPGLYSNTILTYEFIK
ncbi:MAG: SMP-30/gluconolactonase/LRE family protein [Bacteroidales bacterium]|nr:SMP-30/gluconolactonase/LRE family protein [Bacteroidales bacterium]